MDPTPCTFPAAGESNALTGDPEASYYLCALPFLVGSLRVAFNSPGMHVSVVQLAPWARCVVQAWAAGPIQTGPVKACTSLPPCYSNTAALNGAVAALRDSQLRAGDVLPGITVITAVDGGDPFAPIGSIHPRDKQVGRSEEVARLRVN